LGAIPVIVVSAVGIYSVYVEAILGLAYVRFLRACRGYFVFRANPFNPDGFFGWKRLRQIIYNLEAGLILTAITAWFVSYFLVPTGLFIGMATLAVFVFIVLYVFTSTTTLFRQQATRSREQQV
jgi:hypothetical protein